MDQGSAGQQTQSVQDVASLVSLPARLEAILYLKGRPLTLQELSSLVGLSESETEQGMLILIAGYAQRDTPWRSTRATVATACSYAPVWENWCATCCR